MEYESKGCLHEMFVKQACKSPKTPAVVCDDGRSLSFEELDNITDILAINLRHKGCGKDKIVGIYLEKCLEYPIVYIAALKAGGAYMPLELSYPEQLLVSILEDAEPVTVITTEDLRERLPSSFPVTVLSKGWEDKMKKENESLGDLPPMVSSSLDDLAYVVYSSGTTGKPKGIACPHRGAVYSYTWRKANYPFVPEDRVACNVFFVWEMLRSLLGGIPLYVVPDNVIYDPPLLLNYLKNNKITRMLFTPSLFEAILDYEELDAKSYLSNLTEIWLCGEVVTTALRDRAMRTLPWIRLLNLYSISESHDVATSDLTNIPFQNELPEKDENKRKFCHVGKLLPDVHVVIMDEEMKPLPVGVPGEIYVGGPTLARGYLNRPNLNKERFIERPEAVYASAGDKLYRTGDWGYMLSSGHLEICGRCDSMVKIRGYSIEIQAVEAALLSLLMVNACVVLALGEEGTDKYLVAYVVPEGKITKKEVRAALKTRLPFYMIPAHFVLLQSIPVAPSGKLDKKRLPPLDFNDADEEGTPSTKTEKHLAKMWCEVLSVRTVDVQESFFDLGGHSLLAARLLSKIREEFSVDLTVKDLFLYPTTADMAKVVDNKSKNDAQKYRSPSMENPIDLKEEVEHHNQGFVNMDMILRAFWRSGNFRNTRRWNRGRVLLTGSTGFLGANLLRDLIKHTKVHIFCVVREAPDKTCKERIRATLERYSILPKKNNGHKLTEGEKYLEYGFEHRVTAVKGDISLINLGMSEEDFIFLSSEIDFIVHAAASVNMVYPYTALRGHNVIGTENIILFASTNKIKPLHYISTDAVFPHGMTKCSEDADMLQYSDLLEDGYSQSKWVAEQLVFRARARGLPMVIYRLGNLSGDRKGGYWNPLDFTLLMLKGCTETLCAPQVEWGLEMTPVDFVSEMIVKMTQELSLTIGKVFHIVNPRPLEAEWLFEWMTVHGYQMSTVPYDEWKKRIQDLAKKNASEEHSMLVRLLEIWITDSSFFSKLSTYSQTNLEEMMKHFQVSYPQINHNLLTTYFVSLVNQGVLPAPKKSIKGPRPLEGEVAIVTGSSSGIGAAVSKALAEAGAKVALASRREERLNQLRDEILSFGDVAISVKTDVTKREEVKNLFERTQSTLGPVSILVSCAGVMFYQYMKNCHMDDWEKQVDINCKGVLNGIGTVLPGMLERGKGHIITISSSAGRKAFPGLSVYSGTKFFVEAVCQGLRQEVAGSGVKVTTIQPGDVRTEIGNHSHDREAQEEFDMSSKTKILEPQDIASAVVYAVTQPPHCAVNEILVEPRDAPC